MKTKTTFKLHYDKYFDEYQVRVFENGFQNHKRTYFTDDKEDAIETMATMKEEQEKKEKK